MTMEEAIWWINHLFEIRKEEYFNKGMMKDAKEVEEAQRMAIESLSERTGEWIDCQEYGYVECPFCGHATNCEDNKDELHFCFYCGAIMKGGGDE